MTEKKEICCKSLYSLVVSVSTALPLYLSPAHQLRNNSDKIMYTLRQCHIALGLCCTRIIITDAVYSEADHHDHRLHFPNEQHKIYVIYLFIITFNVVEYLLNQLDFCSRSLF